MPETMSTSGRAVNTTEAGLRRLQKVTERSLELVVADLSEKDRIRLLARKIHALRGILEHAARNAYGSDWKDQLPRMTAAAEWEAGS
jgi:hypothetical protein